MFFNFSQTKAAGKKFLLAAMVLVLLTSVFVGCKTETEDNFTTSTTVPAKLVGKWGSSFNDYHEIKKSGDDYTYEYYMPESEYEGITYPASSIFGIIRSVTYNSNTGIIIYELTTGNNEIGDIGKFSASYYKELTNTKFRASTVYSATLPMMFDTLPEAKAAFTVDATGDYIGWWGGPFTKE